jgi:hypothetical protein
MPTHIPDTQLVALRFLNQGASAAVYRAAFANGDRYDIAVDRTDLTIIRVTIPYGRAIRLGRARRAVIEQAIREHRQEAR